MKLLIYGAGGFGGEVLDMVRSIGRVADSAIGFLDDNPLTLGRFIRGVPVVGGQDALSEFQPRETRVVIAVGHPHLRLRLAQKVECAGFEFETVFDPSSLRRSSVVLEIGSVIAPRVFLSSNVRIGRNSVVNTGTVIGHDSEVGVNCVIGPMLHVGGNTRIREGVEIGAGSALFPGIEIGAWSKVAMLSAVVRDLPENVSVSGNPARVMIQREARWHLR